MRPTLAPVQPLQYQRTWPQISVVTRFQRVEGCWLLLAGPPSRALALRPAIVPRVAGYFARQLWLAKETFLAEDCTAESTLNDSSHRDSFGSVEGIVEKLAQGHAVRFAVYPDDALRGVPCYLSDEHEDRMTGLLLKRVRVEGLLRHDSGSGPPVSIRDVTNIEVLEPPATDPADLWGILPTTGDHKPEELIRAGWAGD